jgi:hypothetical protein
MTGYLVAQAKDHVRIEEPGRYFGLFGIVIDEKPHHGPSVTARDCCVDFADDLGGGTRWFQADDLYVVEAER